MDARIASIYRHPVKGFTPERLTSAALEAGACFPCDRLYAVEDGPSGFDPAAPDHISKMKFTVLAKIPAVAKARTAYDAATGVFSATAEGHEGFAGDLRTDAGRAAFEAWLAGLLGDEVSGPLKVIEGPGAHRFMDSKSGYVSIVNLASVRDLGRRVGMDLDPLRFRANLYVEGWPAWVENDWTGKTLTVGGATAEVLKPIVRCAATHVDPTTAERDVELVKALFDNYGHMFCGIYLNVTQGGTVGEGDRVALG
ncbi:MULTISPECIES: MOSC domain-containing protein [unclassified Caulobacter]|uniref:MOSC domain-containing protein n=1 Tax=unclassified Caulobacter TaxID=2648921 RepID=UPI0006F570AC|nr:MULTISPECIES: MOSC N-terminal beta barrel domain-containing protein [unclassified Caulobacter]KQV58852.1 molybdenum cofactor sulfurase [Caulobacter sp. Root342]KQV68638.1 molybdenum cofactor sulfurase [Caulobacter sp. Root343]